MHQPFIRQWGSVSLSSGHGTFYLATSFLERGYAYSGNDAGKGCYSIGVQTTKTQVELWSSQAVNVSVSYIAFGK